MVAVHLVRFVTPKGVLLNGYWIGALRPKVVIVWVHGLGSSMFSKQEIARLLARDLTAVLMFNNRGHDKVASVQTKKGKYVKAGAAHERFTDCVDDIDGAIRFVRKTGAKEIYLAGHSTGCQKSIYWAHKRKGRGVKGIILLAPVSDWAAEVKRSGRRKVERASTIARSLVRRNSKHSLLPEKSWHEVLDAQRFLNLYSPDSTEELFPYAQPKKLPRIFRSIRKPVLILWADRDEFADRSSKEITTWFGKHLRRGKVVSVPRVKHSFKGGEKLVAREVQKFLKH